MRTAVAHETGRKFCVYAHSANGAVFYVGKGDARRPFDRAGRNKKWHAIAKAAGYFDVHVMEWYAENPPAVASEADWIRRTHPAANIATPAGTVGPPTGGFIYFRLSDEDGKTMQAAAREVGLSLGEYARRRTFGEPLRPLVWCPPGDRIRIEYEE